MTYNPATTTNAAPSFTNVYVNPSSYRAFMKTGRWPDKTINDEARYPATFVQFYPALFEVARRQGTVKSAFAGH